MPSFAAWLFALLVLAAASAPAGLVWCYRTLADVVCYPRPDPEHPDRLVGVASCGDAAPPSRPGCVGPPEGREDQGTPGGPRRDTDMR